MSQPPKGTCWNCGAELGEHDYGREARCPACDKATHVCRNCRFYTTSKANECAEPMAERVLDKTRPNFCDYFGPSSSQAEESTPSSPDDLLKAAEDLFK